MNLALEKLMCNAGYSSHRNKCSAMFLNFTISFLIIYLIWYETSYIYSRGGTSFFLESWVGSLWCSPPFPWILKLFYVWLKSLWFKPPWSLRKTKFNVRIINYLANRFFAYLAAYLILSVKTWVTKQLLVFWLPIFFYCAPHYLLLI